MALVQGPLRVIEEKPWGLRQFEATGADSRELYGTGALNGELLGPCM